MLRFRSGIRKSATGVVFTLGVVALIPAVSAFDAVYDNRVSEEIDEARELVEDGESDQFDATFDDSIVLIHGHCFDKWLHAVHDSVLTSDSGGEYSRGPPKV